MLAELILMNLCSTATSRYRDAGIKKSIGLRVFLVWLGTVALTNFIWFAGRGGEEKEPIIWVILIIMVVGYFVMFGLAIAGLIEGGKLAKAHESRQMEIEHRERTNRANTIRQLTATVAELRKQLEEPETQSS